LKENNIKISALIITYNEEDKIKKLIENLDFVDEIVVIDSYSTDKTISILKQFSSVKIIQNKFENFSKQRNFAIKHVKNNWILFIDADEIIPRKLKKEIISLTENEMRFSAYEIYRQFYFKNTPIRFSGWQTDKVFRLFNKKNAFYEPTKLVHETLNISGKTTVLKNKLAHHSYTNYEEYKTKMTHYARLRAKELFKKGLKPNFYHFYIKPSYRFFNHYIFRLGFLDGKYGYTLCRLNAMGVKQRYIELIKIQEDK
jgi:glycosyltransferase involved in cell wall biosynthesis